MVWKRWEPMVPSWTGKLVSCAKEAGMSAALRLRDSPWKGLEPSWSGGR